MFWLHINMGNRPIFRLLVRSLAKIKNITKWVGERLPQPLCIKRKIICLLKVLWHSSAKLPEHFSGGGTELTEFFQNCVFIKISPRVIYVLSCFSLSTILLYFFRILYLKLLSVPYTSQKLSFPSCHIIVNSHYMEEIFLVFLGNL